MPRQINTTSDRGLDREIDALWRALDALKSGGVGATTTPSVTQVVSQVAIGDATPQVVGGAAGMAGVSNLAAADDHAHQLGIVTTKGDLLAYGATPDRLGVGTNGKVLVADSSQTLGLRWAILWDFARLTGTTVLSADNSKLYLRVLDAASFTLTLPAPASHSVPIWVRALSGNSHTLKRAGSENIDGAASDLTLGSSTAGQVQSVLLVSNGTDWYTLDKKIN